MRIILITQPRFFEGEAEMVNIMFARGLRILHLRKPQASREDMERFVRLISPDYRDRVVVHTHYDLIPQYGLRGAHLGANRPALTAEISTLCSQSYSCHTFAEVMAQKAHCEYVFLSPIFNSISKQGYKSAFTLSDLEEAHRRTVIDHQVVALGGVTPDKLPLLRSLGFGGAALLGDVWEKADPIKRLQEYL